MTDTTAQIDQEIQNETDREGKYLTFSLGKEEYGVGILKVREIIGMVEITEMPKMPTHVKGVINLRGKVSPVVDLRMKFSMEEADYTARTCIVLVDIVKGDTSSLVGLIVDSVSEVMNITGSEIEPPPDLAGTDTSYIVGIAKKDEKVIMLLDIEEVMAQDDFSALDAAA